MPKFNYADFKILSEDVSDQYKLNYQHEVKKALFKEKKWYCKTVKSETDARMEVMAQEFFRLIIPHQPETLLAHSSEPYSYYVLSQEVPCYRELPSEQGHLFCNGQFTGLGQVVVCAMYLQEIDLKNGNICLDDENRVIKIDGDWCFAEKHDYKGIYELTPKGIASLPYPEEFTVYNWLGFVHGGLRYQGGGSYLINKDLSNSMQFRAEANQALIKICLVPDSYIEAFVAAYMPGDGLYFIDFLKSRRDALTQSALKNDSFKNYLHSTEAQKDSVNLLGQMRSFEAGYEAIIKLNDQEKLLSDFEARKKHLYYLSNNEFQVLLDNNKKLIKEILILNPSLEEQLNSFLIAPFDCVKLEEIQKTLFDLKSILTNTMDLLSELRPLCSPDDPDLQNFSSQVNTVDYDRLQDNLLKIAEVIEKKKSKKYTVKDLDPNIFINDVMPSLKTKEFKVSLEPKGFFNSMEELKAMRFDDDSDDEYTGSFQELSKFG